MHVSGLWKEAWGPDGNSVQVPLELVKHTNSMQNSPAGVKPETLLWCNSAHQPTTMLVSVSRYNLSRHPMFELLMCKIMVFYYYTVWRVLHDPLKTSRCLSLWETGQMWQFSWLNQASAFTSVSVIRNTHRPDMYGFPGLDLKFIWKETAQFWPWIASVYNNIFGIQPSFCVFCVTFGKCVEFQGKTITFMFNYLLLLLSNLKKKDQIWPRMEELKGRKVLNVYVVSKKPPEPQPQCAKPSLRLWGE